MDKKKAKEILEINVKEAGKSMPPDVKDALEVSIKALDILIQLEAHGWDTDKLNKELLEMGQLMSVLDRLHTVIKPDYRPGKVGDYLRRLNPPKGRTALRGASLGKQKLSYNDQLPLQGF